MAGKLLRNLKLIGTICFGVYVQSSVAATYNCEVVSNTSSRIGNEYMQLASKYNLLICGHKNAWQNTDKGCGNGQRVLVYKNYSFAGSSDWHQDAKIYKCNTDGGAAAWEHTGWPKDAPDCWAREYEGHNVDSWDHFIDVGSDKEVRCKHKYMQYDSDGNKSYWCKAYCIRDKVKKSTTSSGGSGSSTQTSTSSSSGSGSSTQTSTSQNSSLSEVVPDCSKVEGDAAYDSDHIRWKLYDESRSENSMRDFTGFTENFSDLNAGEWAVAFSFGMVKGQSLCSDTAGVTEQYSVGNPNEQEKTGDYCWCKANGVNKWVSDGTKADSCMSSCAMVCATYVGRIKDFRNLVFGCSEPVVSKKSKEKEPENKAPVTTVQSLGVNHTQEDLAKKQEIENAKNVLSNFFAAAESGVSVWKNEEGKFNTARLASDMTAGALLGTVGGVVSGTVIKKKQIKKGFESLQCYVGGKLMAGWGDTFNVDLAR